MTSEQGINPLVGYANGSGSEKGPRTRVIGLSLAFAAISMLFAYQLYVRVPADFWVFRSDTQPDRQSVDGNGVINSYSLIVENRSLDPQSFRISIAGIKEADLIVPRNPFILPSNVTANITVYVRAARKNLVYRITQLRFILENITNPEIRIEQEATFIYPQRTDKGLEI